MNNKVPFRVALGPQVPVSNLGEATQSLELPAGHIAVISASWQEAEGDHEEYQAHFEQPLVDLNLYQRTEKVFAEDAVVSERYRARQQQLQELQALYRIRLRQLKNAARKMLRSKANSQLLEEEQQHSIEQLRSLDQHHLKRVQQIHDTFDEFMQSRQSAPLLAQREEIDALLKGCGTVMITGGNILVLLNRLRLFNLADDLTQRNLIAWSAGVMVLSDVIVLYHDRTPEGRRDTEVLGHGLGVIPDYVFFPDAKKRLRIHEQSRLDLLRRRFAPARCITLENGSILRFDGNEIASASDICQFVPGNQLSRLHA